MGNRECHRMMFKKSGGLSRDSDWCQLPRAGAEKPPPTPPPSLPQKHPPSGLFFPFFKQWFRAMSESLSWESVEKRGIALKIDETNEAAVLWSGTILTVRELNMMPSWTRSPTSPTGISLMTPLFRNGRLREDARLGVYQISSRHRSLPKPVMAGCLVSSSSRKTQEATHLKWTFLQFVSVLVACTCLALLSFSF